MVERLVGSSHSLRASIMLIAHPMFILCIIFISLFEGGFSNDISGCIFYFFEPTGISLVYGYICISEYFSGFMESLF